MVRASTRVFRAPLSLCLSALVLGGCDLRLDASREVPPDIARRMARARADLSQSPEDLGRKLNLAELHLEARDYFAAADLFKSAEAINADEPRVYAGLAEAYFELGYFRACADSLRTCFGKNRDQPGCLYVFGALMEGLNDPQALREAQRSYSRLLEVARDLQPARPVVPAVSLVMPMSFVRSGSVLPVLFVLAIGAGCSDPPPKVGQRKLHLESIGCSRSS